MSELRNVGFEGSACTKPVQRFRILVGEFWPRWVKVETLSTLLHRRDLGCCQAYPDESRGEADDDDESQRRGQAQWCNIKDLSLICTEPAVKHMERYHSVREDRGPPNAASRNINPRLCRDVGS